MSQRVLSQAEIDALFARYADQPLPEDFSHLLTAEQLDTVGEIGNICMGTAATTLSQLLGQKVTIGYPQLIVCRQEEVFKSYDTPYLLVQVGFKSGLNGFNVLVITEEEVAVIANLMMGGDGQIALPIELSELELSAAQEAMNQMIGSASTAMTDMFGVTIDITPPVATMVRDLVNADLTPLPTDQPVVVARFETTIGDIVKTTIMQITSVEAARDEANYLLMKAGFDTGETAAPSDTPAVSPPAIATPPVSAPALAGPVAAQQNDLPNLSAALSLPVQVTLLLGKISSRAGQIAAWQVGAKIPLSAGQLKVQIYAGEVLLGEGEVIQENGHYFMQITYLSAPTSI
ncbi:MAG: flagellar motor switch phosphatase FliY [Desulfurispora sp.]|uniref:flagellar motor switch phosphatase FliY n=1 Tax=Desulfurispora sp. TaxID=3014275 RepID=UPI00404AB709